MKIPSFSVPALILITFSQAVMPQTSIAPPDPPDIRVLSKKSTSGKQPAPAELQTGIVNTEQVILLQAGKNMIGLCVDPKNKEIASLFPDRTVAYRYDPQTGYVPVKEMLPGEGYFVLSETDQMGSAVGPPVIKTDLSLAAGEWRLIAGLFRTENFLYPNDAPDGSVVAKAWTLGPGSQYEEKQALEYGRAYWVKADESGQLTIGRENTPGVINSLSVTGTGVEDTTNLVYEWADNENDPDKSLIEWRQNGIPIATGKTVLPEQKTEGYPLEARVLSFDGIDYGALHEQSFELEAADIVPPKVVGSNLTDAYNPLEDILLELSEELDPATLPSNVLLKKGSTTIPSQTTIDSENPLRLKVHASNVPYSSDLRLTIRKAVTDKAGNQFDGNGDGNAGDDYTINFRTRDAPDTTPPQVASNNLTQQMPLDSDLEFTFNEQVDVNSVNDSTVQVFMGGLKQNGLVRYNEATKKATFQPDLDWQFGTVYDAVLSKDIKDVAGNLLDGNKDGKAGDAYSASFRTVPQTNFPPSWKSIPDQTVAEDTPKTLDLKQYLTDDHIDKVSVQASGNTNISVTIDNSFIATLTPSPNWNGAEEFTFTASDPEYSAAASLKMTVTPVNDGPVVSLVMPESAYQNEPVTLDASGTTDDSDLPSDIQMRWDINNSGWTPWVPFRTIDDMPFQDTGTIPIKVQAKDSEDALSEIVQKNIEILPDTIPPKVIATNAQDGFPINNRIEVEISESLIHVVLNNNFSFTKANGASVSGLFESNYALRKAYFTPSNPLQPGQRYRIRIKKEAVDNAGNQFDGNGDGIAGDDYVREFITEQPPDTVPPKIASHNLSGEFPVDGTIRLYVPSDEILNVSTVIPSNVLLKKGATVIPAQVAYDDLLKEISIDPSSDLEHLTDYTVQVKAAVHDLGDNQFDGNGDGVGGDDYVKSFRTAPPPDNIPPKVVSDNLSSSFNVWGNLELTLSEAMAEAAINEGNVFLERVSDGVRVYGAVSWSAASRKIVFDPDSKLEYDTQYRIRALKSLTDLSGNNLDGNGDGTGGDDYSKTFKTQVKPSSAPVADLQVNPTQGFAPLPVNADADGSDAEDPKSSLDAIIEWGDGQNTGWQDLAAVADMSHTYNTAGSYTVVLRVKDTDGKIGTDTENVNVVQPDTEPPYVSATNISNNFFVGGNLTFTFNEPMDEQSLAVTLKKGGTSVSFSKSYSGSNRTLTVNPSSDLDFSSNYTAEISESAKDLSGNRLDGNHDGTGGDKYTKSFTTQAEPNDPPNADFELDKTSGKAPLAVNLDASSSTDAQDPVSNLLKKIDWGDGTVTNWQTSSTAMHTFNNPGTYTITLYVQDTGGLQDATPKTANITVEQAILKYLMTGNISAFFEGGDLSGVTVKAGGQTDITDAMGNYSIELPDGTYTLTAEKLTYHTATRYNVPVHGDITVNLDMASGNLNMDEFNRTCRSRGKTQRITSGKTVYFNTKRLDNGEEVPQEWKDSMRSKVNQLKAFCPYNMNIVEGDAPPYGQAGYIIVSWPNSTSIHAEHLSGDVIDYATIQLFPFSGELHELTQTTGARGNGTSGVLAGGSSYTQHELMMGRFLFDRKTGNTSPDNQNY